MKTLDNKFKKLIETDDGRKTYCYSTNSIIHNPDYIANFSQCGRGGIEWENYGLHPVAQKGSQTKRWIECGEWDAFVLNVPDDARFGRTGYIDNPSSEDEEANVDGTQEGDDSAPKDKLDIIIDKLDIIIQQNNASINIKDLIYAELQKLNAVWSGTEAK